MPRRPEERWQFLAWWLAPPIALLVMLLWLWKEMIRLISCLGQMAHRDTARAWARSALKVPVIDLMIDEILWQHLADLATPAASLGKSMRKIVFGLAAAAAMVLIFLMIPVQPVRYVSVGLAPQREVTWLSYNERPPDDRPGIVVALERLWAVQIKGRLRWLGIIPTVEPRPEQSG